MAFSNIPYYGKKRHFGNTRAPFRLFLGQLLLATNFTDVLCHWLLLALPCLSFSHSLPSALLLTELISPAPDAGKRHRSPVPAVCYSQ